MFPHFHFLAYKGAITITAIKKVTKSKARRNLITSLKSYFEDVSKNAKKRNSSKSKDILVSVKANFYLSSFDEKFNFEKSTTKSRKKVGSYITRKIVKENIKLKPGK